MKVHELITELQKHDPEMEVQIQQGFEEYAYVLCQGVKTIDLIDGDAWCPEVEDEIEAKPYVVIKYE